MSSLLADLRAVWGKHWRVIAPCVLALLLVVVGSWLWDGTPTPPVKTYAACRDAGYPFTDTDPSTCSDGTHTFVGPYTKPAASLPPITSQQFEVLVDGDSAGPYPNRQEVISTQGDWARYWRAVHSAVTLPPIISVDFSTQDVIALSEGKRPTTGYDLKVTSIEATSVGTGVDVTESIPSVGCKVANTPSNRYFVVSTAKLPTPVSFHITTEHHTCQ